MQDFARDFEFDFVCKFFRDIKDDPEATLAIIELDEKGENYQLKWGLVEGGKPTRELPSHLMNHGVKKLATNGVHRVIYHAHTTNVIALTLNSHARTLGTTINETV